MVLFLVCGSMRACRGCRPRCAGTLLLSVPWGFFRCHGFSFALTIANRVCVMQAPPRSRGPSVRAFVSNPEPIRVPCHEDLINGSSLSVCVRLWMRSGLAMMIESDFYATDAGRQHFADQLKSIRYCVQEVRTPFDSPCPVLSVHNPLTGSPLCLSYRPPTVRRFHCDSIGLMPRPLPLYSPASLLCISSRRSLRVFDLRQLRL